MNDKRRRGKKLRVWVHLQWFFENHTVRGTDPQVASCETHAGRRKAFQCNNASQHSDKTRLFQNTVQKLHKMHASANGEAMGRRKMNHGTNIRWKHSLPHTNTWRFTSNWILWSATPTPSFRRPKQNEGGSALQSSLGWVRRVTGYRFR